MIFDVFQGEDGLAGRHATYDGKPEGRRRMFLKQLKAPGGAGDEGDGALPRKGLQVLLRGVGGTKTEAAGDIGPGGGIARFVNMAADDIEHLLLPGGEAIHSRAPCGFL
jgi:hypothetical protein